METRQLGSSGIRVSVVGLGCNNLGRPGTRTEQQEGATEVVLSALDTGVNFFDTADIYGKEFGLSERMLGVALRGRREEAIIATKFGHVDYQPAVEGIPRGSRAYVRIAVGQSLERLAVDHIDLYQLHTPDPQTPIEETLGALDELVREGKVRAIGHSNFSGDQTRHAEAAAEELGTARFVSAQNEYNLLARGAEHDILPAAQELGLAFLPFFPLANGLFTGKFTRTDRPADSRISRQRPHVADDAPWDVIEAYAAYCADRSVTMLEATFGWLLARPALASVIAGATTPEQIAANAVAGNAWRPTPEEVAVIDALFA